MKCQILFSGKKKKNIINLSSAENAQRVVKAKHHRKKETRTNKDTTNTNHISRVERKTSVSQMVVFPQT